VVGFGSACIFDARGPKPDPLRFRKLRIPDSTSSVHSKVSFGIQGPESHLLLFQALEGPDQTQTLVAVLGLRL